MALLNDSKLAALWSLQTWPPYRLAASCMVKVRCRLVDGGVNGGVCEIMDEQLPPGGPEFVDDDPNLAPLWAGDFAGTKPKVDILFRGSCHLEKEAAVAQVVLALGTWRKELVISGERKWQKKMLSWKMSEPEKFTELALDPLHAFGGPELAQNPWGRGCDAADSALPCIEYPQHRIRSRNDAVPAASFTPVHLSHPRRMTEMGTFDDVWAQENWPLMPEDFQASAAQVAPLDQQLEHVVGNEELYLKNLIAGCSELRMRLPGLLPRWFYATENNIAQAQELPLMLDTVAINGDEGFVDLVWRGCVPVSSEEEAPSLEHYVVCEECGKNEKILSAEQHIDAWQESLQNDDELIERRAAIVAAALMQVEKVQSEKKQLADSENKMVWDIERVRSILDADKDLSEAELAGLNLTSCDFSDAILTAANLEGCNLEGCCMKRAVLTRARLRSANCRAVDLSEADMHCADCTGADLSNAICEGTDFSVAILDEATATAMQAEKAIFFASHGASLQAADANLSSVDLIDAQWTDAGLARVTFDGATAYNFKASGSDLSQASMSYFGGVGADFENVNLSASNMQDSTWSGANMAQAKMTAANCAAANFTGIQAQGLDAQQIDAQRALFRRADLTQADFSQSDLRNADAWGATLTDVNMKNANTYDFCIHECVDIPQELKND